MGTINEGTQTISTRFKHPATGTAFQTLINGLIKPGIYSGGLLTYDATGVLTIAPFKAAINADADHTVNISTSVAVSKTSTSTNNLIYMTYSYLPVLQNYADFGVCSSSTIPANAVVFGESTWSGPTCTGVTYSYRTYKHKSIQTVNVDGHLASSVSARGYVIQTSNALVYAFFKIWSEPYQLRHIYATLQALVNPCNIGIQIYAAGEGEQYNLHQYSGGDYNFNPTVPDGEYTTIDLFSLLPVITNDDNIYVLFSYKATAPSSNYVVHHIDVIYD